MSTKHLPDPPSSPPRLRSRMGVDALIFQACAKHESELLAQVVSPLFPQDCPWSSIEAVPPKIVQLFSPQLNAIPAALEQYRTNLTATAGQLAQLLHADEEDVRAIALKFAKLDLSGLPEFSPNACPAAFMNQLRFTLRQDDFPGLFFFLSQSGLPTCPRLKKVLWAEHLLGACIAGEDSTAQLSRVSDARFWRRAIRVRLLREREHFFLRLRLVHKRSEAYVTDMQLSNRLAQLRRQEQWMKDTVLVPRYLMPGMQEQKPLTLNDVTATPEAKFAKVYTFVKAMEDIAVEQNLAAVMMTISLEPEWHPNPSHGQCSWNGASPREAHQSIAKRWQSVLRDLDRLGVGLSGLRVVEPHKDACPHWHLWLLYQPQDEALILRTVMKYFPYKLKIRHPKPKEGEVRPPAAQDAELAQQVYLNDVVYETLDCLLSGRGRLPYYDKEGAQVDVARIDRSISTGSSYVMQYMSKNINTGQPKDDTAASSAADAKKRKKQQMTAQRVDSFRSLWGINTGQLFGVAKCLTAWDEFRRLQAAPKHPFMKKLWMLARGTAEEGRIAGGAGIRGDAKGFIEALGGLAACRKKKDRRSQGQQPPAPTLQLGRLTESGWNTYGERIEKTKGVALVERKVVKVVQGVRVSEKTGKITPRMVKRIVKTVVARVFTRLTEWELVPVKSVDAALERARKRTEQLLAPAPLVT